MSVDLEGLRRRAALPWAQPIVAALRTHLAPDLARAPLIPPPDPPSGWAHRHLCPVCQDKLPFAIDSPHRHRCASCGAVAEGRVHDEAWVYQLNLHQAQRVREAAVLHAATGDAAAAGYARDAVLGYARAYLGYAEHGTAAGTGRLQPQSLCEAVWMLPVAEGCRWLHAAGALADAELAEVAQRMFAPACALLRRQTWDVHNIHVWHAAALTALGPVCGRHDDVLLAERVIARNLERGVLMHGLWWEVSPVYHFYTCQALIAYAIAARAAGRRDVAAEALPAMLRAPLPLLLPGGRLPPVNDGWIGASFAPQAPLYEAADGLYGGFAPALAACYGRLGAQRTSLEALLHGPAVLPDPAPEPDALTVVDGVVVLRRPRLVGWVKATGDAGGHDHPDRPSLNLELPGARSLHAAEPGNPGYGSPLHRGWFKRTAAHNTVLLDGEDQRRGHAWVARTVDAQACAVVKAMSDTAYPGAVIHRICAVGDGWALDWVRIVADRERDARWLFHASGGLVGTDGAAPAGAPAAIAPNEHLVGQRRIADGAWTGCWRERDDGPARLHVRVLPPDGGWVGAADAPDLPTDHRRHCLAMGARGAAPAFVAVFVRADGDAAPEYPVVEAHDAEALRLRLPDGSRLRILESGAVEHA